MHIRPFRLDQTNTRLSYLQLGSSRQDIRQVIPSSGRDDLQLDRIGPLLAALSEVLTTGGTAAIRGFHHCSLHRLRAAVKTITDYTYTPRSEFTKFSGHLYDKHCHTLKTLQLTCGTVAWSLIAIMQENKTKDNLTVPVKREGTVRLVPVPIGPVAAADPPAQVRHGHHRAQDGDDSVQFGLAILGQEDQGNQAHNHADHRHRKAPLQHTIRKEHH